MMWKKIKILEMSSYVWELITDLCLHKTFCANLTALVWLNQSLILKLIFNTESQDETISTKFNLLETFQRKEILRYLRSFFEPLNGDLSFGSWTKAAWYFRNCHKKERMCNLVCHTWRQRCIARKLRSFSISGTIQRQYLSGRDGWLWSIQSLKRTMSVLLGQKSLVKLSWACCHS